MPKHKNLKKTAIIILAVLFFSGCAVSDKILGKKEIQLESFLPANTLMTFMFDTSDSKQVAFLNSILDKLPRADDGNLLDRLRGRVMEDILKGKYSYETDIKPIFGEGTKVIIGLSSLEAGDVPHPYILAKINNQEAFDNFLQVVVQAEKGEIKQIEGHNVFFSSGTSDKPDNGCLGSYKGFLLLVDSCSSYEEGVSLAKNGKNTLTANKNYKKVVDNLGEQYLAGMYLNINGTFELLRSNLLQSSNNVWMNNELVSAGEVGGFALLAMSDGFGLKGYVSFDKSKLEEDTLKKYTSGDTSLIENIPGDSIIFYSSGFDLADNLKRQLSFLSQNTGQDIEQKLGTMLQDTVGIDLEEDLYSWMRQGYALTVHSNEGSIIPGITLLVDASEVPDIAKEVVTKLDGQMSGLLTLASMEDEKLGEAISKDEVAGLHRISIDFAKMQELKTEEGAEEEVPEGEGPAAAEEEVDEAELNAEVQSEKESIKDIEAQMREREEFEAYIKETKEQADAEQPVFFGYSTEMFASEKLEIWYGVTDKNHFVLSTMLNFPEKYGSGLGTSSEFTKVSSKVEGYDAVGFYMESAGLLDYADTFFNYLKGAEEVGEEGEYQYEIFKKYIFPFKSVIISGSTSKDEAHMGGFVRIE